MTRGSCCGHSLGGTGGGGQGNDGSHVGRRRGRGGGRVGSWQGPGGVALLTDGVVMMVALVADSVLVVVAAVVVVVVTGSALENSYGGSVSPSPLSIRAFPLEAATSFLRCQTGRR